MILVDSVWLLAWFAVGLVTFQVRGIKQLFTTISSLFSVLSLLSLSQVSDPVGALITSFGLDYISGIFTTAAYFIGANISRYEQFGEMSSRIILYILVLVVWIVLEASF